ncbi:hypothetical protein QJS66_02965 [Kocuria rhizophila]|nr:hypothetical protein QJS66_02965 [Kocuria rhizophila]
MDPRLAQDADATSTMAQKLSQTIDRPTRSSRSGREGPALDRGHDRRGHLGQRDPDLLARALPRRRGAHGGAGEGSRERQGPLHHPLRGVLFVSRVDTEIKRLDAVGSSEAAALKGKAGLANAHLASQVYEQSLDTER